MQLLVRTRRSMAGCYFVFCLLTAFPFIAVAQFRAVNLEHFTVDDGLSHSSIYSAVQTTDGFLWFGTEDGLNRFDGYQFEQFFHNPNRFGSLTNSNISTMVAESDTTLWLGTWGGGINIFNTRSNRFSPFLPDSSINEMLRTSRIQAFYTDRRGTIWAGTFENGLFAFDRKNGLVKHYRQHPSESASLSNNRIWSITEDSTGKIWCATGRGISIIEPESGVIRTVFLPGEPSNQEVRTIFADKKGRLWLGTATRGIFILENETFTPFSPQGKPFKAVANQIFQDREGMFWIATLEDGAFQFNAEFQLVEHLTYQTNRAGSLSNNDVRQILQDESGIFWMGTRGGGLHKFDRRKLRFGHHYISPENDKNPLFNRSWAVYETSDHRFMVGTEKGLHVFSSDFSPLPASEQPLWDLPHPENLKLPEDLKIRSITEDSTGSFWIGTSGDGIYQKKRKGRRFTRIPIFASQNQDYYNRIRQIHVKSKRILAASFNGLLEYQPAQNRFVPVKTDLIQAQVRAIECDSKGNYWIATHKGVFVLDSTLQFVRHFTHDPNQRNSLSFNGATSILFARDGAIWIGTEQGLNRYDLKSDTFRWFFRTDGLANHTIHALVEDTNGRIWGTTNVGTFLLDPVSEEIRNFDVSVGLQGNIFAPGAAHISPQGRIMFGGNAGVNIFHPDSIILSNYQPPLIITDIHVFEKPRSIVLNKARIPELRLAYFENFISFDVVSLDFANPRRNLYAHRLIGLDDNWMNSGTLRHISYTDLQPGTYRLQIRGSNSDGIWSPKIAEIALVITPPFWQTLWFRALLILLTLGSASAYTIRYVVNLRRKNKTLKGKILESDLEIQDKDELFKLITENAADWIVVIEPDGTIEYSSPAVERMLHISDAEITGTNIAKVLHPKDENRFFESMQKALAEGTLIDREVSFINKDHKERIFQLSGSGIERRNIQTKRMLLIAHDITNLKETERTLKRAKIEADRANNSKSAFLAGMSHELRTPLNAILGFTQILGNDRTLSQKHRSFVDILHRSGKHLLSMINDVLDLSKIEAGKMDAHMEEVDLANILQDVRSIFTFQAREKNISFTTDILGDLPECVESDGSKIRQILINFLGNAIKFTEKGGILVTVAYKETPPKEEVILQEGYVKIQSPQRSQVTRQPGVVSGYLTFAVADTGHGIPPNQISEVFKPFRQTGHSHARAAGTGLGLAICRSLVQLLGGTLYVKSTLGTGSTFAFMIPVRVMESTGKRESAGSRVVGIGSSEKRKVLILDDIETNVLLLTELLQPVGFDCFCANSGEQAVLLFQESKPDLLLFDLRLPGMSGEETLQKIRKLEHGTSVPAIAITASVLDESRETVLNAGFASFIHKPFRVHELFNEIARVSGIDFILADDENTPASDLGAGMSQLADALAAYDHANRAALLEAIELTDFQALARMAGDLPESTPFKLLRELIQNQDLKSLLTLTEMLEKRNLV